MTATNRQPDLAALRALLSYNATLPQLALDAACRGDTDLARAYLRVARQRGVECAAVAAEIEKTARGVE